MRRTKISFTDAQLTMLHLALDLYADDGDHPAKDRKTAARLRLTMAKKMGLVIPAFYYTDAGVPGKPVNRTVMPPVPKDWPVQPLQTWEPAMARATCGTCGRSWDDGKITGMTPVPSARCPFESFHKEAR